MALRTPSATLEYANKTELAIRAVVPSDTDPVSRWQIAVSRDTSLSPSDIWAETTYNPQVARNLITGVLYYYWVRYKTTSGVYSPWSPRYSAYTVDPPHKPAPPVISNIGQTGWNVTANPPAGSIVPFLEYVYELWGGPFGASSYSKIGRYNYTTPSQQFQAWTPAYSYSITVQMRTQSGWSPWSDYVYFNTLAGARVLYQGTWRFAVPYVKVNGVWKLALPYARVGGVWKHSLE